MAAALSSLTPAMLAGPATAPPLGQKPNFVDPPSQGGILIVISSILVALMLLFVFNRIYAKTVLSRQFGWEDGRFPRFWLHILTLAYYSIIMLSVTRYHIGVHQWNVTLGDFLATPYIIDTYLTEVLSAPTFLAIKVTFFLLYYQIFHPVRFLRIAIWVGAIITTLVYVGFTIAWFILGTPRRGESWQAHLFGPEQAKGDQLSFPIPAFGLVTDVYIFIIPFLGIFRLQLPLRKKIGVFLIFLTGILAVIASILRLVYTKAISENTFGDLTYNIMPVYLTIVVEMTLGVMITCMPALSKTLRHVLPTFEILRSRVSSFFSNSRSWTSPTKGSSDSSGTSEPSRGGIGKVGFVRVMEPSSEDMDSREDQEFEMGRYDPSKTYNSSMGRIAEREGEGSDTSTV